MCYEMLSQTDFTSFVEMKNTSDLIFSNKSLNVLAHYFTTFFVKTVNHKIPKSFVSLRLEIRKRLPK